MKLLSSVSVTAEKLVEITAKLASRMHVEDEEFAKATATAAATHISREANGLIYCNLCNKGPFTKKGMFLHITRVHRDEVKALLEEELRARLKGLKST
jgi:hypothetical protein